MGLMLSVLCFRWTVRKSAAHSSHSCVPSVASAESHRLQLTHEQVKLETEAAESSDSSTALALKRTLVLDQVVLRTCEHQMELPIVSNIPQRKGLHSPSPSSLCQIAGPLPSTLFF
ncbi:hypothetical protein NPIL_464611 [Nephila pilipes]|uniref:Secreted protein n=1 Tax=Nephila pilipes TaxID=299642 RepID=A0A8X6PWY9_NEPPI|nr:hypothetical protein NPIL_464611 [Nephila pilipes]